MNKHQNILDKEVIFGHRPCQSRDIKWLLIEKIYEKCYRPNSYNIGGTYIEDVPDLWFNFKTEIVGKIFLLHIFVVNRLQGQFNLSIANTNIITINKKRNAGFLDTMHKPVEFDDAKALGSNYVVTYSFNEADVEILKDLQFYISVSLRNSCGIINPLKEMAESPDFKALLNDPICSDFVIESADGVKFSTHKIILTANSEVFKAMLKENTAESQNKYMKMVDVESDDLRHIIYFIYTGTLENLDSCNFINLMMLGDKYDLKGLVELSKHALICQISKDNVFDILTVADLYNCDDLKLAALKYIKQYKVKLESSMFEELNNIELVKDICKFVTSY